MHRVFIVEDHPVVRDGLRLILSAQPGFEVAGTAADAVTGLDRILEAGADLAIVDIGVPGDGLSLIRSLHAKAPHLAILVFSGYDERVYGPACHEAGARGFVSKKESTEHVVRAAQRILGGELVFRESTLERLDRRKSIPVAVESPCAPESLSNREFQIFRLLAQGLSTGDIAETLHISNRTVETHGNNIRLRLGAESMSEVRKIAVQWLQKRESEDTPAPDADA